MWMFETAMALGSALALVAMYLLTCIRVLNEYERGVVFRLGRAMPTPGTRVDPGLLAGRSHDTCGLTNHHESHRASRHHHPG